MAEQPIFLKVYHSGKLVTSRQFLSAQISIGSSSDGPSLVLADPSVHFWHALIERREGGQYYVSDLGAPTGVYLNSQMILESPLKHGDQIKVGDFVIHFFINVPFVQKTDVQDIKPVKQTDISKQIQVKDPIQAPEPVSAPSSPPPSKPSAVPPSEQPSQYVDPSSYQSVQPEPVSVPPSPKPSAVPPSEQPSQYVDPSSYQSVQPEPVSVPPSPKPSAVPPSEQPSQYVDPSSYQSVQPEPVSVPSSPKPSAVPPSAQPSQFVDPSSYQSVQPEPVSVPSSPKPSTVPPSAQPSQYIDPSSYQEELSLPEELISPLRNEATQEKQDFVSDEKAVGVSKLQQTEVLTSFAFDSGAEKEVVYKKPEKKILNAQLSENRIKKHRPIPSSVGTYAPKSAIQNLDHQIPIGNGPVVEVTVAWKERILSMHYFSSDSRKKVIFGSDPKSDIFCPNLLGKSKYTLLNIQQNVEVCLSDGIKASMIDHKGKYSFEQLMDKGLIMVSGDRQIVHLAQHQLVRLNFSSCLVLYIRYANRSQKAASAGMFNFSFSEMVSLMMSFLFMSLLFVYLAPFSLQFLDDDEDMKKETAKKPLIEFQKKRVVRLKLADNKIQRKKKKISVPHNQPVPKKPKEVGIKKEGSQGRLGQVAKKKTEKSKKKTVTSVRPGGAVKSRKSGAGAKSPPRKDVKNIGLLGVFGKGGMQKALDKAYSGAGGVAGMAEHATGYAGQKESHTGEGIGTKFKSTGSGGKGSNIIGVSGGIKTKGRGGGGKGYGRGGRLGQRGGVRLEIADDDWDVEGGIDRNAIRRVLDRKKPQLEWCYDFALQKNSSVKGKVLIQWEIRNEKVKNIKIGSNTTGSTILARCLMTRLRTFRFVGTGLTMGQIGEVSFPFVFQKR